jgi:hypothetical protein
MLIAVFAALALPLQDVKALDGEWIYVEDRTEGRPLEEHQFSMGARLRFRIEPDAFVYVRSDGEIRVKFDGSPTDVTRGTSTSRYTGGWKDGAFVYQLEPVRLPGDTRTGGVIVWTLRPTSEGLIAGFVADSFSSVALYKHPQDIALPTPAKATIKDVAWIAGDWTGTRGTNNATAIEERWSPPSGGAMLATSRTVRAERMTAFEFLRIVERDGTLVFIAQPNGSPPTEFVLTEIGKDRAVFANPRHDSPQKITYELTPAGLTASIGYTKGGRPTRFDFKREG